VISRKSNQDTPEEEDLEEEEEDLEVEVEEEDLEEQNVKQESLWKSIRRKNEADEQEERSSSSSVSSPHKGYKRGKTPRDVMLIMKEYPHSPDILNQCIKGLGILARNQGFPSFSLERHCNGRQSS